MYRFLSVCLSVRLSVTLLKIHISESIIGRTLPQYKAFIGASRKNTDYTLKNIFVVNK